MSWFFVVNIRMHDVDTCTQYLIITIWTLHWRPPFNPSPLSIQRGLQMKLELISVSSCRLELCIRAVNIVWCYDNPSTLTADFWQLVILLINHMLQTTSIYCRDIFLSLRFFMHFIYFLSPNTYSVTNHLESIMPTKRFFNWNSEAWYLYLF